MVDGGRFKGLVEMPRLKDEYYIFSFNKSYRRARGTLGSSWLVLLLLKDLTTRNTSSKVGLIPT